MCPPSLRKQNDIKVRITTKDPTEENMQKARCNDTIYSLGEILLPPPTKNISSLANAFDFASDPAVSTITSTSSTASRPPRPLKPKPITPLPLFASCLTPLPRPVFLSSSKSPLLSECEWNLALHRPFLPLSASLYAPKVFMMRLNLSTPNAKITVASTLTPMAWASVRGGRFPSEGSETEPVRHTKDRMEMQKAIIDHPSHVAGAAKRTHMFHQIKVFVLCAFFGDNQ